MGDIILTTAQLRELRRIIAHEGTERRAMAERLERFGMVVIRHLHPGRGGWTVVATKWGCEVADNNGVRPE